MKVRQLVLRTSLALLIGALSLVVAGPAAAREPQLTVVDSGAAVYYSPSFDYGGWEAIIARRIAWGEHDPATYPYSPEGHYCVQPDYVFGNVLTVRNRITGAVATCTVADMVAPQDLAHWRANAAIEVSWRLFVDLGLEDANAVDVMAIQ